ncbi:hypothetical protein LEP1GSC061_0361 [Leptospira wolffii serovar Khorat str. Khorat-H2]|nr:hypothetical protein LEP1GSC061_0361 [Leptospira wolffii serovar Khorat str. Khorat-H2]
MRVCKNGRKKGECDDSCLGHPVLLARDFTCNPFKNPVK